MPIEFGIWRIDGETKQLASTKLPLEKKLEELLEVNISIIGLDVLIIGRQVPTAYGGFVDLLGIDRNGDVVVIELKRDKTPKEVVAQTLDYGSWARTLNVEDVTAIYGKHAHGAALEPAFLDRFGIQLPEAVNLRHRLVVVASELDPSTERIVDYLFSAYGVRINVMFFRYFEDGPNKYLARTWLIDPHESPPKPPVVPTSIWDGRSFYVIFGESDQRSWEDGRQYGFVQAGGGLKYRKALQLLFERATVFAFLPKGTHPTGGYVGIGTVTGLARRISEFSVESGGQRLPYLEAPHAATNPAKDVNDPDLAEYVVPVTWDRAVPRTEAFWQAGLFSVPTVVGRLRDAGTIHAVADALHVDLQQVSPDLSTEADAS